MARLTDLFEEVQEENLTKEQLEAYYTELSMLSVKINLEYAKHEKEKGIFMGMNRDQPAAQILRDWKASDSGQRLIDLKAYKTSAKQVLDSIKTRIYSKL